MQTILGSGGAIGTELVRELSKRENKFVCLAAIPSWSMARPKLCQRRSRTWIKKVLGK